MFGLSTSNPREKLSQQSWLIIYPYRRTFCSSCKIELRVISDRKLRVAMLNGSSLRRLEAGSGHGEKVELWCTGVNCMLSVRGTWRRHAPETRMRDKFHCASSATPAVIKNVRLLYSDREHKPSIIRLCYCRVQLSHNLQEISRQ